MGFSCNRLQLRSLGLMFKNSWKNTSHMPLRFSSLELVSSKCFFIEYELCRSLCISDVSIYSITVHASDFALASFANIFVKTKIV